MAALTGDDQSWKAGGYGALGSATPRTEQGGNAPVDSYGVWGLLGTPADIKSAVAHLTTPQEFVVGAPLRGAIVARNTLPDEGVAIFGESRPLDATTSTASGFIAGRSPFAGEATGVFGEATERGVIGIASTPGGIGVYGGSVNGVASSGVFGDAGDSIGVTGRANSALGPGTAPGGFADPNIHAGVLGKTAATVMASRAQVRRQVFLAKVRPGWRLWVAVLPAWAFWPSAMRPESTPPEVPVGSERRQPTASGWKRWL